MLVFQTLTAPNSVNNILTIYDFQSFFNDGDNMETDDPFASLGGLGSGLGANFGPRTAPFRSQSFNVGSGHGSGPGGKKDKQQDPPVEHDLYVSLDDINKVRLMRESIQSVDQ